jgi:uncharacterized protein (TIGR00369 family)
MTIADVVRQIIAGSRPPPPIATSIGFRIVAVEPDRTSVTLEATERDANPVGTVHGGVLCAIADSTMGLAYASTLSQGESFTTLELKINFLRAVQAASLLASGSCCDGYDSPHERVRSETAVHDSTHQ